MNWTDTRVENLKKLWNKGLSASQIAKELGNISRNAVIGKVHRLGLCSRQSPIKKKPSIAEGYESHDLTDSKGRWPLGDVRYSIHDLTDYMCRWPFGDPRGESFYYCGKPIMAGFRYCEVHVMTAYQWSTKKRSGDRSTETS